MTAGYIEKNVGGLGHFDGKAHILPLRVYYEDTDLSGVIYHANYLRFMERGRTEFFRLAGVTQMADLESAEPTAWAIRNVEVAFHRPGRVDDALTVHTILTAITGARLTARQRIYAGESLLSDGRIEACIITLTGKPRRIPPQIRDLLTPFLYETET
jgi:acyl-CoA thioester hydrolase